MELAELVKLAPPEKVDDLLMEVGHKNYTRVTKHAAVRHRGRGRRIMRRVFDEQFGAKDIKLLPPSFIKLDELRMLAGLKPRYLPEFFRVFGAELISVTPNLRTTVGITYVTDSLGNSASRPAVADYMALTENSGAPAAGDTTLTAEITTNGLQRAQGTYGHSGANTFYTLAKTWTASGAFTAVQKAGLFNASSVGTMFLENTFTSTALQSGDQLTVTWTVNV